MERMWKLYYQKNKREMKQLRQGYQISKGVVDIIKANLSGEFRRK